MKRYRSPAAVRLYGFAARRLLPKALIDTHGEEMVRTFGALYEQASRRGRLAELVRFLGRETRGLIETAWSERATITALQTRQGRKREGRRSMPSGDILYGLKSFARRPGFTSLVVVILAIGIGFVAMVLTLAHSVYLGSVPYGDPERIVVLWRKGPEPIHVREATSYLNIRDWAERGDPFFDGLAAYTISSSSILRADGAERVMVNYVDPYFFEALDVDMALGRALQGADNRPPAGDAVIVVSYGFWQSEFGGDRDIIGASVNLSGHPHTIVGVMSQKTRWLLHEPLDLVVPFRRGAVGMSAGLTEDRGFHSSIVVGRLRSGVTIERAQAGMEAVSAALQQEYPDTNAGIEASVTSFSDLRGDFGRLNDVVTALGVGAGLVFFLSCISVTLLLLARFVERLREFAVRMALGASRQSLIFQALAEGISITLVAGLLGFGLAFVGVKLVFAGNPLNMYSFAEVSLNENIFLVTVLLALATTLFFGLVPAIRSAKLSFHQALRASGGGASRERNLLRRGLVMMQVAVSVAVLVGAGLVLRSLYEFTTTDYGFNTNNLVYMRLILDGPRYDDEQRRIFYRDLDARIAALPGVVDAGLWGPGLPGSSTTFMTIVPEGKESDPSFGGLHTWIHVVTPGAAEGLGLRLVDGRMIDETDRSSSLPSVVVSQSVVETLWPGERAIGKRIVNAEGDGWRTVVGVVSDARMRGLGRIHAEMLRDSYISVEQRPAARINVFVRAEGDEAATVQMVREAVHAIDPTRAVFEVSTMEESMAQDRQELRFTTTLMVLFGSAAALLTTLGIYSVASYSTSRRTREIGVRVALGAGRADVVALVLRQTFLDMTIGIAIGISVALGASGLMSSLLYGVTETDPIAYLSIVPALMAVALAATIVPIRRALAVGPPEALRYE